MSGFEGLSGNPVYTDSFAPNQAMSHINLTKWADLTILCPASANTLNKMANGIADNLITSLFLAHDWSKPYIAAPAMNTMMYDHPATRESLKKLSGWGVEILPAPEGRLACGDFGNGKLLEPDEIYRRIMGKLRKKEIEDSGQEIEDRRQKTEEGKQEPGDRKTETGERKVLITSGGTKEAIDGVRFIANMSTGKTGAALAGYFSRLNYSVTFLYARDSALPEEPCEKIEFVSFADLDRNLNKLLSRNNYDAVIHLAAVSDFSPVTIETGNGILELPLKQKLESDLESLSISFKRNYKIVERLKEYSINKKIIVVAFKLTSNADPEEKGNAIRKMFNCRGIDYVVSNDLSDRTADHRQTNFEFRSRETEPVKCPDIYLLSEVIEKIIREVK